MSSRMVARPRPRIGQRGYRQGPEESRDHNHDVRATAAGIGEPSFELPSPPPFAIRCGDSYDGPLFRLLVPQSPAQYAAYRGVTCGFSGCSPDMVLEAPMFNFSSTYYVVSGGWVDRTAASVALRLIARSMNVEI